MELRDLRTYLAVIDAHGFTAAANRLHMVQSSVSDAVGRLETELGLTLLERRRQGTRPTPEGVSLERWARLLCNLADRALRDMRSLQFLEPISVRIGMLPTITPLILPELLTTLRTEHPGVSISVREGLAPRLFEQVRVADLDLAVIFSPVEVVPGTHFVPVTARPLRVMVGDSHEFADRTSVDVAELSAEGWVTYPRGNPGRLWLDEACRMAKFEPRIAVEVGTPTQQRIFVEAGQGIAMVPLPSPSSTPPHSRSVILDVTPPLPLVRIGYAKSTRFTDPAIAVASAVINTVLRQL
jgi:DNA-binding transcriptional LysR family regulator